jgi:cellobiose dehydrogenase (acceptor)
MSWTYPGVDGYDNWSTVWDNPRQKDATQYVADQSGVFAGPTAK